MQRGRFPWQIGLIGLLCLVQAACMLLRPERLPGEDTAQFRVQVDGAQQEQDESIVAEGPGWRLTVADVERRLATLEGPAGILLSPTDRRGTVVNWLIEMQTIALIAREAGLDDSPEVRFFVDEMTGRQWLRFVTAGLPAPADEEVEAAWAEDRFGLQLPLRRRLFTFTLDSAEALDERLDQMRQRVMHGGRLWLGELPKAARDESTWAEEREIGGDWYWVTEHDPRLPEPLREAVFTNIQGGEPVVIAWDGGYTAVWMTAELDPSRPTLDDARLWIVEALLREAQRDAMVERLEALRETHPAEIDTSLVETLAASRQSGPSEAWRPRRLDPEGMLDHPATTLGWEQAQELEEIQRGWLRAERALAEEAPDGDPVPTDNEAEQEPAESEDEP